MTFSSLLLTSHNYVNISGQGNLVLWVIIACSILAFTIFIERFLHLRSAEINTDQFVLDIRKAIQNDNITEALTVCENTPGPLPKIVSSGLMKQDRDQQHIEQSMETAGLVEIAKLEKNAKTLSIIAHITPLIGLLGTVLGFIRAFSEMRQAGLMDISATRIGEAMEFALTTTAAGLVVAIPTIVAYNYITSRIQRFVLEMQTISPEIVDLIVTRKDKNHEI